VLRNGFNSIFPRHSSSYLPVSWYGTGEYSSYVIATAVTKTRRHCVGGDVIAEWWWSGDCRLQDNAGEWYHHVDTAVRQAVIDTTSRYHVISLLIVRHHGISCLPPRMLRSPVTSPRNNCSDNGRCNRQDYRSILTVRHHLIGWH